MKTIEINTTQSVVINYNLASVYDRLIAFTIDLAITLIGSSFLFLCSQLILKADENNAAIVCYTIPLFTYNLLSELISNGQSIGKRIMNIKVMKLNGEKPSAFDFMIRWVFRLLEILLSFGTIAIILITSTSRSQRIGDFIAGMVVIRTRVEDQYYTDWIVNRKVKKDYVPIYPEIKAYSEEDMMILKKVLNRYLEYKNAGHKEALEMLSKRIEEQLQVKAPQNKVEFLNQLIKDYVVLTR